MNLKNTPLFFILILIFDSSLNAGAWQIYMSEKTSYQHRISTKAKDPYNGFKTFAMAKLLRSLDTEQRYGIFGEAQFSNNSEDLLYWDQYSQWGLGFQFIPSKISKGNWTLRGLRFYTKALWRDYYNQSEYANNYTNDLQLGIDYYYGNVFKDSTKYAISLYANGGFRESNFSSSDYLGLISSAELKYGPKYTYGDSIIMAYATINCDYSSHSEFWWENYIKVGIGVKWFPYAAPIANQYGKLSLGLKKNFHLFAETLKQTNWLGDKPTSDIPNAEFRVGISLSTRASYRN